jgi:hypothetical protein
MMAAIRLGDRKSDGCGPFLSRQHKEEREQDEAKRNMVGYPFQEGKSVFSMIWRRDKRNGPGEFPRLTIVRIESESRHYLLWRNQGPVQR